MTEHNHEQNHESDLSINNEEELLTYSMKTAMKFYIVKC